MSQDIIVTRHYIALHCCRNTVCIIVYVYSYVCMYICTYAFHCLQSSFQKLELENIDKDNKIHQKDLEILQLQKDVERLSDQVMYLNRKVNAVQNHLRQRKVCGYV